MEAAPAKAKPQGRLLVSTQLDAKDELEERLERCVGIVQALTNGLSEREANDALTANVCKGPQQHEEVCLGLFSLVLTESAQAQRCYRDLTLLNRDGMNIILVKINQILMEKFLKLQDVPRTQLVWLIKELVKSGCSDMGADGVVMTLLKQIAGQDIINPTSSSSSLASSWVDTSSRPCGFAFAGAASICSRRASPGPAELRRTGTPGSGGGYNCSSAFGVPESLLLLSVSEPPFPLCIPVRHGNITDIRTERARAY
ncbi:integrator complex subunit 3 [Cottoperca gobio]|uniref:Integrator complex subunit 3 n=1 Tax=Cottoperca gobio TaxID=56716 RepID=A0A6J2PA22_COTGO|nr:integrator complex subunit 3 [Cottoperca gobio]